jgi:hypothetical protein
MRVLTPLVENVDNYIAFADIAMNPGYACAKFFWDKNKHELSFSIPDYTDDGIPRINLKL